VVDDDGGDGSMELTKLSRQRIIVLADEGQHTADPVHGSSRCLPGRRLRLSWLDGWAESAAAEGGNVDPQLGGEIFEVGE
jgi:hypothetical protein